jgi:hypothetical protein
VGFTSVPAWVAFSPVKNNIVDASKAAQGFEIAGGHGCTAAD